MDEFDLAPEDVVPRRGLSREALLALNAGVGKSVIAYWPGQPVANSEGEPFAVSESEFKRSNFASATVTRSELEAVGLTASDVPNLRVLDIEKEISSE